MLTTCQTVASSITLKNTGTATWDTNTRLATTEPENRVSDFADSTWVATDRPAQVSGTVPPGGTYEFKFDFHAPPTPGMYTEYFGMVEDGVVWFSAPGQGGPPDNDIEANIQVVAGATNCTVDQGAPDGSAPTADAGTKTDAGKTGEDAGKTSGDAGSTGPTGGSDGGIVSPGPDGSTSGSDAGIGLDNQPASTGGGGCTCDMARSNRGSAGALGAIFALAMVLARRKRR
jgi:hypothetical protein